MLFSWAGSVLTKTASHLLFKSFGEHYDLFLAIFSLFPSPKLTLSWN